MMYNFYLILIFIILLILVSLVSIKESHPMMMGVAMFMITMVVILVMSVINTMSMMLLFGCEEGLGWGVPLWDGFMGFTLF